MKYFFPAVFAACTLLAIASHAEAAGDNVILPSTISVDAKNHTATLPIYRGTQGGRSVWYIVTDASDPGVARRYRAIYAPSLARIGDSATQSATKNGGTLAFEGAPDFSKTREYVASSGGFPPKSASPGGVADASYSPFVRVAGMAGVLNAPILATGDGPFDVTTHTNTEDRVIAIDTVHRTVKLVLARGFVNDRQVYYISSDASDPVAAAVERATYVPKLAKAKAAATIPIGVIVNGPQRGGGQGLAYLALRTALGSDATLANQSTIGSPFNVLSLVPDRTKPYADNAYSPLWSVQVAPSGGKKRITSYAAYAAVVSKPAGFVVNCPVIAYDDIPTAY